MDKWPNWKSKLEIPTIEGGLRLTGSLKECTKEQPLISYVTVVRNNAISLERVIKSVQSQTYRNIEHIILDGASTDVTIDIILKYKDNIDYYASEPDKGLYDALNKIIPLCRGQLILVLNSDDWLSDDSAEYAASQCDFGAAQLIAGTAKVLVNKNDIIHWKPKAVTANSYFSVANCNHNAIYASREAYELSGPYDSSYKIAGDFKWIMSCYDAGVNFSYTDTVLVNYSLGGLSSDIYWHMEESKRIIKERFTFLKGNEVTYLHYIYYPWREGFNYTLVGFNPKTEIQHILDKYCDKEDLTEAIDLDNEFLLGEKEIVNNQPNLKLLKFKRFISKFPMLFNIFRWIYHRIKA